MVRKISQGVTAIAISSLLFACGESTTSPDSQNNDIVSFETYDALPECTSDREGDIVLVRSEGQKYKCYAGTWALLVSDGESGSADSSTNGALPGEDGGPGLSSDSKQEEATDDLPAMDELGPASSSSTMRSSSSAKPIYGGTLGGNLMYWVGADAEYRVETGLDVGTGTSGYWYVYADDADGGASTITWPVPLGNDYVDDAMDPVIDVCGGLCGTISLEKGSLTYDPYVGVGFNVGGDDESGTPAAVDASKWNGVCVGYSSDIAVSLEMGLGDAMDAEIGFDNPFVTLAKSPTGSTKCYTWKQFKVGGWGLPSGISGADVADKLVALKLKFQGKTGTTVKFNIMSITSNEYSGVVVPAASSSSVASSSSNSIKPNPVIGSGCDASLTGTLMKWCGDSDEYSVNTGLDNGSETSGYWFTYDDEVDGGKSQIVWPQVEPDYGYFDPVMDYCKGVCGAYVLDKGTLMYNPYVGLGFNVGGENLETGAPVAVDASKWGGICVSYAVDSPMTLEIGLGDVGDAEIEYDNPVVTLAKAPAGSTKCFAWNQFKQAGWGSVKITGEAAAAKIASLKFKIQATSGSIGNFNIMGVSSVM